MKNLLETLQRNPSWAVGFTASPDGKSIDMWFAADVGLESVCLNITYVNDSQYGPIWEQIDQDFPTQADKFARMCYMELELGDA